MDTLRGDGPFVRWEGIVGLGLKGGESMAGSFRTVGGGFGGICISICSMTTRNQKLARMPEICGRRPHLPRHAKNSLQGGYLSGLLALPASAGVALAI